MASDLPDEFDVIVLGTGLPETLLAAAFSRIGLTVLHLDRNAYYCGNWASFSLRQIPGWIEEQKKAECYVSDLDEAAVKSLLKYGEKAKQLPEKFPTILSAQCKYHVGKHLEPNLPTSSQADSSTAETKQGSDEVKNPATETQDGAEQKSEVEDSSIVPGQFDSASEELEGSGEARAQAVAGQGMASPGPTPVGEGTPSTGAGEGTAAAATEDDGKKKRKEWFSDDVEKEWRKFSLDLAPKLLFCSGNTVELLIVSDVGKYCEFRTVSRVLTAKDGKLEKVPCSRADVFSSKALSLLEKRILMKFLTFAAEYEQHPEEYEEFLNKRFVELLAAKKLSAKMQYFVLYSIAMATSQTPTLEGLRNTQKFICSLGRYGNSAFLFPLYGSAELPQGFCRLSAVFGGVYVLTLSASHLLVNDENKCTGVITSAGQRISCKYLIADPSYLPLDWYTRPISRPSASASLSEDFDCGAHFAQSSLLEGSSSRAHASHHWLGTQPNNRCISRGIYVTDRSILPGDGEDLSLLQLPHEGQPQSPVTTVLELPPSAMVTPRQLYVVHTTRQSVPESDDHADLQVAASLLFADKDKPDDERPRVLWSLEFQMCDFSSVVRSRTSPQNVFVVTGPGVELETDRCVDEAKAIFKTICPEEEFLPKPPHPDDIIYVDTEEVSAAGKAEGDWAGGDGDGGADTEKAEGVETEKDVADATVEKEGVDATADKEGAEAKTDKEGADKENADTTADKEGADAKTDKDHSDVTTDKDSADATRDKDGADATPDTTAKKDDS